MPMDIQQRLFYMAWDWDNIFNDQAVVSLYTEQ